MHSEAYPLHKSDDDENLQKLYHSITKNSFFRLKGVGLGYGRQLYFHCLLKYMVICVFENSPSIPSFLVTQMFTLDMGVLKK
jgi:predicted acetyltransferase